MLNVCPQKNYLKVDATDIHNWTWLHQWKLLEKCPNTEFSLVCISRIRAEYGVSLRIQSEYRKIRTRKTPYLDTFNAVEDFQIWKNILHPSTKKQYGGSRLLLLILISLFQIPLFVLQFGLFFRNIVFPELVTWQ